MTKHPNFFGYFGGKYYYAKHLIPMFPEHNCYVEVFGGAGNVLIQKPISKLEVFNDINSDIVNLFRVLRNDYDAFIAQIENIPYSREEYYYFRERLETETNELQRAVMWFCAANMSFSGVFGGGWGFSKTKNHANAFKNKAERLHEIRDRLRCVLIENEDFEFMLESYDTEDTFFYLDPPYVPETRKSSNVYAHEMSYEDHEKLIDILKNIKGKVMLSGYANDLYDTLGWKTDSFDTVAHSVIGRTGETHPRRTEVVWMNYEEGLTELFT